MFQKKDSFRWLNIAARTAHIACAGVVFGGMMLQGQPGLPAVPVSWRYSIVLSGLLLLLLEWCHDPQWPHRGKGLLVQGHVLCTVIIPFVPGFATPLLWAALVFGSVGSHMPRHYRHWSILYGPENKKTHNSCK